MTERIRLLEQEETKRQLELNYLERQKEKYNEITEEIKKLQIERKLAYSNLKDEIATFGDLNEEYVILKQNEQEVADKIIADYGYDIYKDGDK